MYVCMYVCITICVPHVWCLLQVATPKHSQRLLSTHLQSVFMVTAFLYFNELFPTELTFPYTHTYINAMPYVKVTIILAIILC